MNGYAVDPDELQLARAQLRGLAEQARAGLRALSAQAAGVRWDGGAGSTFHSCFAQWHRGAGQLVDVLGALADLVGEGGSGYQQTEAAVTARVGVVAA